MTLLIEIIASHAMELFTALTVVILFYYTKETYLLRKEAQRQTDTGFTPYLTLRSFDESVHMSNLGKGVAKEICFEGFLVHGNPVCDIPTIGPDEKRELQIRNVKEGWHCSLLTRDAPDIISLTYTDLLGNSYTASFSKRAEYQGSFIEISQCKKLKNL